MEKFTLVAGNKTPYINLQPDGNFELSGKSIPENSAEFYHPVYEWLDNYATAPQSKTVIKIQLEYFNTSSSKCLLDIFRRLEAINKSGKSEVKVIWLYEEEDEDMMEAGDDYQTIVKVPFEIKKVEG